MTTGPSCFQSWENLLHKGPLIQKLKSWASKVEGKLIWIIFVFFFLNNHPRNG